MYPAFIVENGIKPYHIGKQFLILFKNIYERRLALKPEAKKDKKIKGIVETLKIVLNGTYGG